VFYACDVIIKENNEITIITFYLRIMILFVREFCVIFNQCKCFDVL